MTFRNMEQRGHGHLQATVLALHAGLKKPKSGEPARRPGQTLPNMKHEAEHSTTRFGRKWKAARETESCST
jgi:hypothetical protein